MKPNRILCLILALILLAIGCRKAPTGTKPPLHNAARTGNVQKVRTWLAKGADVNAKDEKGRTALHIAVKWSHTDLVKLLINNGADVNATNKLGDTSLIEAAKENNKDVVALLVDAGSDIDAQQGLFLNTSLHWAAEKGHKPVVQLLIESGASVDSKNRRGETPVDLAIKRGYRDIIELLTSKGADVTLHLAALRGDLEKVRSLIAEGTDVNDEDAEGHTAFHMAAGRGHINVVRFLLAKGADPDSRERVSGATPLNLAVEMGQKDMAELLLSRGADVNARCKQINITPLQVAASQGNIDMAALLIARGADVNTRYESNWHKSDWTPLRYAIQGCNTEMIQLLIDNGARLDVTDRRGRSLATVAMYNEDREIVELLLAVGADVTIQLAAFVGDMEKIKNLIDEGVDINLQNEIGYTPLHYAAMAGNTQVVELLITEGARIDINSSEDFKRKVYSPLHLAVNYGRTEVVRLLISKSADVEIKDAGDCTPLHQAAYMGHKDIVEILLAADAQVDAQNRENHTSLYSAARAGQPDIVELLLNNGADINVGYVGQKIVLVDMTNKNPRKNAEQLVAKFGPYSIIVTDPQSVMKYLGFAATEDLGYVPVYFDNLWIPEKKDLEGIDPVLRNHLENNPLIGVKDGFDRRLVLRHLHLYNREYSGIISNGVQYIICQMIIHDNPEGKSRNAFTGIHGSGNGVIKFEFDTKSKAITYIDCEFPM